MKLPFTKEQFIGVFEAYNAAIEPAQAIFYAIGLFCVLLLAVPGLGRRLGGNAVKAVWASLGLIWIWDGALYQIVFFSRINPVARIFGALFILQGILFIVYAISNKASPDRPARGWGRVAGYAMIAYALGLYPLVGAAAGHVYPAAPVFGVAPCPTVIFSFGVLAVSGRAKLPLFVVPLLWALVGSSAALLLGIPEDFGLPAAAVLSLAARFAERRSARAG